MASMDPASDATTDAVADTVADVVTGTVAEGVAGTAVVTGVVPESAVQPTAKAHARRASEMMMRTDRVIEERLTAVIISPLRLAGEPARPVREDREICGNR